MNKIGPGDIIRAIDDSSARFVYKQTSKFFYTRDLKSTSLTCKIPIDILYEYYDKISLKSLRFEERMGYRKLINVILLIKLNQCL